MTRDAVMRPTHLSYMKVNDSGPKRKTRPETFPKTRRKVENAGDHNEI